MKTLRKEDIPIFIGGLIKEYDVYAPVKRHGIYIFELISDPYLVDINGNNTFYPPKSLMLPRKETLFEYDKKGKITPVYNKRKRIVFGIRPCDFNAILSLDRFMLENEPADPYYKALRENTTFIVIECLKPGENCFCQSMNTDRPGKGYDLFISEKKEILYAVPGSKKGKQVLQSFVFNKTTAKKPVSRLTCSRKIDLAKIDKFDKNFSNSVWKKHSEKCLSCCGCTVVCPSCSCFDITDYPKNDIQSGERKRDVISCQVKDYSRVAGNHYFRKDRDKRLQHRIHCKLKYFEDNFGYKSCVGCGRCITVCPTGIDMLKIMNQLK